MRRSGRLCPPLYLSVAKGRLICVVRLPRRGSSSVGFVRELAVVASLAAPYLRWLTIFRSQRIPILDDTPHAA